MKYFHVLIVSFLLLSCTKEQESVNLYETIYLRKDGADMPVYMRGNINSKVVILVVHGGPGGSGLEYRFGEWYKDVEEEYAIAYWDQRGQGMSHGHYRNNEVSVGKMVEDMDGVIAILRKKYGADLSVFALGHSWGGALTAKYMTTGNLQHHLDGWIESDGAHDMPKNDIEASKSFVVIANEQIAMGNSTDFWQERLEWAMGIDTTNISDDQKRDLNYYAHEAETRLEKDGVLNGVVLGTELSAYLFGPTNPLTSLITGINTNKKLYDEFKVLALTDELHEISIPVLAIWGKYDLVVPPVLGYDTYNNISSETKKIVIFEKSGHSPMFNEGQKFGEELILFVDANK